MLNKLLSVVRFSLGDQQKPSKPAIDLQQPHKFSSVLRIVHAGGMVEYYYMAIPAARILEKYPSYVLAKPEVFRRPWDSVVLPEKILTPGQKFLLVPLYTVKKLRRKIKKPSKEKCVSFMLNVDSVDNGTFLSGFRRTIDVKKYVTFAGIDYVKQKGFNHKKGKKRLDERCQHIQSEMLSWHPSLTSVTE